MEFFIDFFSESSSMGALFQVILIDLALAGDNAVVIGMAAAALPAQLRKKAILFGIIAATILRILLALVTTQLLGIVGLLLVGGLLLAWVAWKMWQELREGAFSNEALIDADLNRDGNFGAVQKTKTMKAACFQILIADLSMSLDNVLAVAGAAREHPNVLIFGLVLSVALMGIAATFIANLLNKHRWLGYAGLAIIAWVAVGMIAHGTFEVFGALNVVAIEQVQDGVFG